MMAFKFSQQHNIQDKKMKKYRELVQEKIKDGLSLLSLKY